MKLLAKPISSPSRAENFPPPLLRFLRSNGGSRSRGRSRSSPIFIRKRSGNQASSTITQEPSSPKVTCMGQVRVRRSKQTVSVKNNKRTTETEKKRTVRYEWIRNTLFCRHFKEESRPKTSKRVWGKWVSAFYPTKFGNKEKSKEREAKPEEIDELEDTTEEEEKVEVFNTDTPPKNALLLMRCRSEPYRASSLANRFWGSPSVADLEKEEEKTEQKHREEEEENSNPNTNPTLGKEPNCRDSALGSRIDPETEEKLSFCEGIESNSTESTKISAKTETETSKVSPRPLLTRCKSVPARRTENFEGETCFWMKRMGFVDISTTHFD